MPRIICLMYHEIKRSGRPLCLSAPAYARYAVRENEFYKQLSFLNAKCLGAQNVSQAFLSSDHCSSVVLTFDDGCETDLTVAAPALERLGFNATFYTVSGFIGQPGYMSRTQLRLLSDRGFEIGCHSRTHANLATLHTENLGREIVTAKAEIENIIGREVKHFSCPGGYWSREIVEVCIKAGFVTIATSRVGFNSRSTDRYRLSRIPILRSVTLSRFERICRGKGIFFGRGIQIVLGGVKVLVGDSFYRRVRTAIFTRRAKRDNESAIAETNQTSKLQSNP